MIVCYFFHKNTAAIFKAAATAWVAFSMTLLAHADPSDYDHDRALQAVRQGKALSLKALLERVPVLRQGQILEVELEQSHGRWLYEIKTLESGGRLVKHKLDAKTGELLQSKEKAQP